MRQNGRTVAVLVLILGLGAAGCGGGHTGKIPITTASDEARDLFLKGRELSEKLRFTDARTYYEQALAKDPDFALAHLALASSSALSDDFFSSLGRAVELSKGVSQGERDMILAYFSGVTGEPTEQRRHLDNLVENYPNDERAINLRGDYHFGRQEYDQAIHCYEKATRINPGFSQPYNQLGYVYRFLGRYDDAEAAFRRYIELLPDEPNPFDSYAELLMKMGRFEESIANYEKALSCNPHFISSYIGIGHDYLLLDRADEAHRSFRKLHEVARTDQERRQARLWAAAAYLHEGRHSRAIREVEAMYAIARKDENVTLMSADLTRIGHILLEAGKPDQAMDRIRESLAILEEKPVPIQVREFRERTTLYFEGRAALAQGNVEIARHKSRMYAVRVEAHQIPSEIRQLHELRGRIALHGEDYAGALEEFDQANQEDPRVLYLTALAYAGQGEEMRARDFSEQAANFNGVSFDYAFVRDRARLLRSNR